MNAADAYPRTAEPAVLRRIRLVASSLLVVWGTAWGLFALLVGLSGLASWYPLLFIATLAALVLATLVRPRVGGILLILGGMFAAEFFDDRFTTLVLALPAVVLGVVHVLVGVMRPTEAR